MYRFLLSPRWIGLGLLMIMAAATMVSLGFWQLDRYHLRSDINNRIDAAAVNQPVPITQALAEPSPARAGVVGAAPSADASWTRITVTGQYDVAHEILARARTVNGEVGFEIVTPLVLSNGTAVLIDRGWLAPSEQGAAHPPTIPPTPTGNVTVVGRVHAPESRADQAEPFAGALSVRHIAPQQLAASLPFALYGGYVALESQTPPADHAFVTISPDHQNAAMNAGYVAQWWMFALLTVAGFGYLAYREAHPNPDPSNPNLDPPAAGRLLTMIDTGVTELPVRPCP